MSRNTIAYTRENAVLAVVSARRTCQGMYSLITVGIDRF